MFTIHLSSSSPNPKAFALNLYLLQCSIFSEDNYKVTLFLFVTCLLGFDDMDSMYASPEDFKSMNCRNKIRGVHLLEYFVNRCHEIGVSTKIFLFPASSLSLSLSLSHTHTVTHTEAPRPTPYQSVYIFVAVTTHPSFPQKQNVSNFS